MLGNGELGAAVRGGVGTERLRFHLHTLWPRGPATREDARPPGDVQHRNLHLPSSIASTAAPGAVARRRVAILPALPACRPSGRVRGGRIRGGDSIDVAWPDETLAVVVIHAATTRDVTLGLPGDQAGRVRRTVSLHAGEKAVVAGH
ncbi:glycoside hydrolase N-terminal domain-containing protein [Cellulomonas sp. zg-ZUI188]|uniref:Glycoside hydrolase N-terminal domain-containing protein n=1 Tax=Cellulomonas fengjieae TaxID=2819978 RepID=A0ABS3SFI7_9CELL|nr:glycoside hydrolase N-terminal domain-containing protein [Cellulomonas fengjieae]MBO3084520.1 glycoside hydrolase N-terminal domain-containing protein [Cellulomonas fengjieae]QVI67147.1 glycoside hydrolase N-terminal domain-containing protein [Cellulomonas fengjieae]